MERAIEAFDSAVEQARKLLAQECTNTLRGLVEDNVSGEFEFLLHNPGYLYKIYSYKDGKVYMERYIGYSPTQEERDNRINFAEPEEIEVEQVPFDQILHGQLRIVAKSLNDLGSAYRAITSRAVS